jgi:hypothetical protein
LPRSGFVAPASAFPRKRDREISRQRDDREFKTKLLVANAQPAPPESMRRSRCSFGAIPLIAACRFRYRSKTAAVTAENITAGRQQDPDQE